MKTDAFIIIRKRYALIFLMVLFIVAYSVDAEENLTISAAPVISIPLGSSMDLYSLGFGVGIEGRFPLTFQPFYAYGQLNYQNILLQANAGNLNLILAGGGSEYYCNR